ncbi:hypothetical protein HOP52_19250 [Halomonas campisalis]|uniref:Bacteriophage tail tape measure N-terminal domain-containing protein n=1 Tax=Billgrantia campisalis TaxID=74661 RepID=A0ABS9PDP7_9GAMM|nr:hypothetical protein [Halomonas campisalis]MCG6659883.1 hypothetical protein [Halomonas campisalis]MDR5865079.1 hypothetical protein [Halomonas campisalis]
MANDLRVGIRLEADPSNLRAGTQQGVREVRRLTEQTQRSGRETRSAARETRTFSDSMRNAASASAVLHGPLGGVASRFSSIATLANRAGLALGATGLAASAGVMGWLSFTRAAGNAEQQLLRLEARLQATGFAAGVSIQEIEEFAQRMAEDTLTSVSEVRTAAAELAGFSSIAGQNFFRVIELAQDLGGNLTSNVQQIARVLEAPEEGLGRLGRRMTDLTFEQRQMIQEMVETGRQADAMRVILEHLEQQIGGTGVGEAQGLAGAMDTLGKNWTQLKENLGDTSYAQRAVQGLSSIVGGLERVSQQTDDVRLQTARARRELTLFGRFVDRDQLDAQITRLERRRETQGPGALSASRAEADAGRRRDRIKEIEQEAADARVEIERTANDRIIAERDRMLRELEGLSTQGGIDNADLASARAAVEARAAAAIEAAERPAREAADRRAQAEAERAASQAAANQQVIAGLQRERQLLESLAGTERDRAQAMDAATGRLNEFATPAQVAQARALAGAMHDMLEAEQRLIEIRAAEDDLALRIAQQELLAQYSGQETDEYRIQAALLELKHRIGEGAAQQLEQQVRLAHELTRANQEQVEAQRNLEGILDRVDPSRALERQLELIEELKTQFPQYAAALEQAADQVRARIEEINSGLISARNINRNFAFGAARGLDSFAEDLANGRNAIESLGDAFRQFAADFLRQISQMIIQQMIFNALQNATGGGIGGAVAGVFGTHHGGGVVGSGGTRTAIAADEMLILARRNEEVLTTNDPRHRNNQGGSASERGLTIINTFDADEAFQAGINTPVGERALVNQIKRNKSQIKTVLGL